MAYVVESGTPTDRRRVGEIYMERVIDPESVKTLTEVLDAAGSREFSTGTISRLLDEGISALEPANLPADAIAQLSETAKFLAKPEGLDLPEPTNGEDA